MSTQSIYTSKSGLNITSNLYFTHTILTMFRLTFTKRLALSSACVTEPSQPRLLSTSYSLFNKGPPTTQGHVLGKGNDDPQAEAAKRGAAAKESSSSSAASASGEAEPFDAARQAGGESKRSKSQETSGVSKGQSGAFKDQVGGQEGSAPGVSYGGQEDAAADRTHQGIKNTQPAGHKGNFDDLRKMREVCRSIIYFLYPFPFQQILTGLGIHIGGEELPHLYPGLFPNSVPNPIRTHIRESTGL